MVHGSNVVFIGRENSGEISSNNTPLVRAATSNSIKTLNQMNKIKIDQSTKSAFLINYNSTFFLQETYLYRYNLKQLPKLATMNGD